MGDRGREIEEKRRRSNCIKDTTFSLQLDCVEVRYLSVRGGCTVLVKGKNIES
jgi:hypothetical protein